MTAETMKEMDERRAKDLMAFDDDLEWDWAKMLARTIRESDQAVGLAVVPEKMTVEMVIDNLEICVVNTAIAAGRVDKE